MCPIVVFDLINDGCLGMFICFMAIRRSFLAKFYPGHLPILYYIFYFLARYVIVLYSLSESSWPGVRTIDTFLSFSLYFGKKLALIQRKCSLLSLSFCYEIFAFYKAF